jgi:hypothetical protein
VYSVSVALLLARGEPNLEATAQNAALDYVEKMPVIVDKDRQFTSTIDGHFTCQTSQYEPVGFGLIRFLDSFWWALVYDIEVTLTSEQ